MKKEVPLEKVNRLVNCGEVILVSSGYQNKENIITLAWHSPLSYKPLLLGISVAKTHFTAKLILQSEEFIINIPTVDLLEAVWFCGKYSGTNIDKFKETKLTREKSKTLKYTSWIKECVAHIECKLQKIEEVGDHYLFIGSVQVAYAEESLFSEVWLLDKVKLIFHLGRNFFTFAEKIVKID